MVLFRVVVGKRELEGRWNLEYGCVVPAPGKASLGLWGEQDAPGRQDQAAAILVCCWRVDWDSGTVRQSVTQPREGSLAEEQRSLLSWPGQGTGGLQQDLLRRQRAWHMQISSEIMNPWKSLRQWRRLASFRVQSILECKEFLWVQFHGSLSLSCVLELWSVNIWAKE